MSLHSQHLVWRLPRDSAARWRLWEVGGILLHCTSLPWCSGSHGYKRLRALPPLPPGSPVLVRLCGRGRPLRAERPLAADLLASCRGLGGLLSPLALVKQPPPLRPVPAAALPTAWAEFMTRIHQIRRDGGHGPSPTACRMRLDGIAGPSACRANPRGNAWHFPT